MMDMENAIGIYANQISLLSKYEKFILKFLETTGIDIEKICSEYGENAISDELYKQLNAIGYSVIDLDCEDDEVYLMSTDMVNLWIFLLQKTDSNLKIEICEDSMIPMLPFYGFDEKKRHIGFVGYGVFV